MKYEMFLPLCLLEKWFPAQIVGKQISTGIPNCCINPATCLDNLLMLMECPGLREGSHGSGSRFQDPGQGPEQRIVKIVWMFMMRHGRGSRKNHTTSMSICKSCPKKLLAIEGGAEGYNFQAAAVCHRSCGWVGVAVVVSVQCQVQTAAKTFKWNFCVKVLSGKLRPTAADANKLA